MMPANTSASIRVRFAPSPTGSPHVGNIRTALFAWLFSRNQKGLFILRIEDTDKTREQEGSIGAILDSLAWLGLSIDEGVIGASENDIQEIGDYGPYVQSKRLALYKEHAQKLVAKGHAYYCFCDAARLASLREKQQALKQPPRYDALCASLPAEEVEEKIKAGVSRVIRMRIPKTGITEFIDVIKGKLSIKNETIDHQVLIKSDGFPTYHLASVVDDHLMRITHVLRADEWLPSTPKHMLLYSYFGWEPPIWAHVPIILGPDKSKLSKRHGSVSLLGYKKEGYVPEAMVNYLALLGWNPKTNQEIMSMDELINNFDLKKVNKNNPIFDIAKLRWMNAKYIQSMDDESLMRALAHVSKRAITSKIITLVKDRLETLTDFDSATEFLTNVPDYSADILIPKKSNHEITITMLHLAQKIAHESTDFTASNLRQAFLDYCDANDVKRGELLWPLRVSITGLEHSPEPFLSMEIIGKDESEKRIAIALNKISA